MPQKLNADTVEKAIEDFQEGMPIYMAAKKNGIGATTLTRYLKARGFDTKAHVFRKIKFNLDYFQEIKTEEQAYWLGFIAADGSIVCEGTILEISLQSRDYEHLVKFAKAIGYPEEHIKVFTDNKGYTKCRISVCSKKMCSDLAQYGIVPRKGFNLGFIENLDDSLIKHYLRGYFDGDGSISTNGKNRNGTAKYAIHVIATKKFLKKMMELLKHELAITEIALQKRAQGLMYSWNKVGIKQIMTVLNYMYRDSKVYLERKYARFMFIAVQGQVPVEDLEQLGWN